jgi:hypothetical protein
MTASPVVVDDDQVGVGGGQSSHSPSSASSSSSSWWRWLYTIPSSICFCCCCLSSLTSKNPTLKLLSTPWEYFVTIDQSALWQKHVAWAKPKGNDLKRYISSQYSSRMVLLSLLLATEMSVFFNSAPELVNLRSSLSIIVIDNDNNNNNSHQHNSILPFWIGFVLLLNICVTILGILATFTTWNIVSAVSDTNAHCLLRSSLGQYVTTLSPRLVVCSLYLFLLWFLLFVVELILGGDGSSGNGNNFNNNNNNNKTTMSMSNMIRNIFIFTKHHIHILLLWSCFLFGVITLFFCIVVPLSAFGRLVLHTGAMSEQPVLSERLELDLLPSGLHAGLVIRAHHSQRRYGANNTNTATGVTRQYNYHNNNNRHRHHHHSNANNNSDNHLPRRQQREQQERKRKLHRPSSNDNESVSTSLPPILNAVDTATAINKQYGAATTSRDDNNNNNNNNNNYNYDDYNYIPQSNIIIKQNHTDGGMIFNDGNVDIDIDVDADVDDGTSSLVFTKSSMEIPPVLSSSGLSVSTSSSSIGGGGGGGGGGNNIGIDDGMNTDIDSSPSARFDPVTTMPTKGSAVGREQQQQQRLINHCDNIDNRHHHHHHHRRQQNNTNTNTNNNIQHHRRIPTTETMTSLFLPPATILNLSMSAKEFNDLIDNTIDTSSVFTATEAAAAVTTMSAKTKRIGNVTTMKEGGYNGNNGNNNVAIVRGSNNVGDDVNNNNRAESSSAIHSSSNNNHIPNKNNNYVGIPPPYPNDVVAPGSTRYTNNTTTTTNRQHHHRSATMTSTATSSTRHHRRVSSSRFLLQEWAQENSVRDLYGAAPPADLPQEIVWTDESDDDNDIGNDDNNNNNNNNSNEAYTSRLWNPSSSSSSHHWLLSPFSSPATGINNKGSNNISENNNGYSSHKSVSSRNGGDIDRDRDHNHVNDRSTVSNNNNGREDPLRQPLLPNLSVDSQQHHTTTNTTTRVDNEGDEEMGGSPTLLLGEDSDLLGAPSLERRQTMVISNRKTSAHRKGRGI